MPAPAGRATLLIATAGLLAGAKPATGQLPAPGDWIRLKTGNVTVAGPLERMDADSVVLEVDGLGPRMAAPRAQVAQLWVSTSRSRNTWRGMRTGGLALGLLGAVVGFAAGDADCQGIVCVSPAEGAALLGGLGLATGAAAGALLGSFSYHHDWDAVELPRVTVTPGAAGRVALAMQLRL